MNRYEKAETRSPSPAGRHPLSLGEFSRLSPAEVQPREFKHAANLQTKCVHMVYRFLPIFHSQMENLNFIQAPWSMRNDWKFIALSSFSFKAQLQHMPQGQRWAWPVPAKPDLWHKGFHLRPSVTIMCHSDGKDRLSEWQPPGLSLCFSYFSFFSPSSLAVCAWGKTIKI